MHVARMRERRREQRKLDEIARSYEAAGDIAISRFAYIEARAQFERALAELPASSTVHHAQDEARLCEKIGWSLFYGARPDFATSWFERVVERCKTTEALHAKLPAAMQLLPGQFWLESRTVDALEYSLRARAIAAAAGDTAAIEHFDISTAIWLVNLGRYTEAENYLAPDMPERSDGKFGQAALSITESDAIAMRVDKFAQRGIVRATQGRAPTAFTEFDRALEVAKQMPDGYLATIVWDDYANWATALGDLAVARSCRERALLIARERRIAWRIPYLTLRFASTLITAGDYDRARDLVRDALTYDIATPVIRVLASTVGMEIATLLNDAMLFERTMDREVLDLAFRSREPACIAASVAAYAKAHIARGELRRAKTLIARGMVCINQADHAGDVLALAARYGSHADAARAHHLLVERMRLPHHAVAQAYLALWKAYDAQRRRADSEKLECAQHAAHAFARLGWKRQRTEALVLTGKPHHTSVAEDRAGSSPVLKSLDPALTSREQQVAELVLRGLTNRAIAQTLAISEHTVETHMTSILNRLGLRSRWQLIDRSNS